MEAQTSYAKVRQSVVLAVLLGTLFIGGVAGYAARGVDATPSAERTILIPRSVREGTDVAPIQTPASRWTHEEQPSANQSYELIPRIVREGAERPDGTR